MRTVFLTTFLAFTCGFTSVLPSAGAFSLKTGDIILQSNRCYLCELIEKEENTPYSHMGILVKDHGQWNVLEAWTKVEETPLDQFLSRRRKGTKTLVMRLKDHRIFPLITSHSLLKRFHHSFAGKNYDEDFLWNNRDELGEKYYCSEFVAKFLSPFLSQPMATKPMHFDIDRQFWLEYFHGNPPDGQPGISPGDFERSSLFRPIGIR